MGNKKNTEVTAQEAVLTVRQTVFHQEDEKVEKIKIRPFAKDARICQIHTKLGKTINLGNYESARVDVGFTIPCYAEEMVRLFPKAYEFTEEKLSEKVSEIENALSGESQESSGELADIL